MVGSSRVCWIAALVCAPGIAFGQANLYAPAETVAFEDIPTSASDADQNDLALRVNKRCRVGASDQLQSETIHLTGLAAGAQENSSLVLQFDQAPDSVTVDWGGGPQPATLAGSDLALLSDTHELFQGAPAGFVNTVAGEAIDAGRTAVIEATYSAGPTLGVTCPPARFALQRPDEGVTIDDTTHLPSDQPLLARLPDGFEVPVERVPLGQAYPDFLTWLADYSDGCDGTCAADDWYLAPGSEVIARPSLSTTAALPDQAACDDGVQNQDETGVDCGGEVCPGCIRASCAAYVDTAEDTGSGVYTIDPTGAGTTHEVYCDMTTDGGGWTLVASNHSGDASFPTGQARTSLYLTTSGWDTTPSPAADYLIGPVLEDLTYTEGRIFSDRYDDGTVVVDFKWSTSCHTCDEGPNFGSRTELPAHNVVDAGCNDAHYCNLDGQDADLYDGSYNSNSNQRTIGGVCTNASPDPYSGTYIGHGDTESTWEGEGNYYDGPSGCQAYDFDTYTTWVR